MPLSQRYSDFGTLYDSGYYSELPSDMSTTTSTTTTTTTTTSTTTTSTTTTTTMSGTNTTPPKISTLVDEGVEINCLLNPIECYEIELRRTTEVKKFTTEKPWVETTKFWDKSTESISIKWVCYFNYQIK